MTNKFFKAFKFGAARGPKGVLGLEIRPDGIAVAYLSDKDLRFKFLPCNAAERLSVLKAWLEEQGLEGVHCNVVLPPGQYKSYLLDKPQVDDQELVDALSWRLNDMLEFDIEDAVIDAFEFPDDALRGRPSQVNAVVARKLAIKSVVDLVTEAELNLINIDIADLALRNILKAVAEPSSSQAQALLYLRKGGGVLAFTKGATLYLARHFDFSIEALNNPAEQDNVIQTLALEIQRSFDYFESQLAQLPPQELVVFGPNSSLPLVNMLGSSISAKVSALDTDALNASNDIACINCLLAIGAALREGDS